MKKHFTLALLAAACALPAAAQMTPAQTNMDASAARMEARNARGSQLTAVGAEQAMTNALQRCANLPAFYRSDCEARVQGKGDVSGSVIGGGLVKESVTSMPQSELEAQRQGITPMQLPAPRN